MFQRIYHYYSYIYYSTDLMKVDDHTSYLYDACDYLLEISEIAFNN